MKLSIIIVSWNVKEKLRENLKAIYDSQLNISKILDPTLTLPLKQEEGEFFEVFVVDNNSADETAEMVKTEFPQVKLFANRENLGFAKANNQAIRKAQGDFILLLNPDMRVFPETFFNMIYWMENNKQAWVVGCNLINENGKTIKHVRRFPLLWDQLAIVLKLPHILPGVLDNYIIKDFDYTKAQSVDSIRGGFFMIRRGALDKIGLLDEQFFLWFEEVDFCQRIKKAGGEVWYTPVVKCVDFVGQSFRQVKKGATQKYFRDSMLKYFKKWHPAWQYYCLKIVWPFGLIIAFISDKLRIKNRTRT